MISLTGNPGLPPIRLARHGRDLVFHGEMLARGEAELRVGRGRRHVSLALYKSLTGKFILSISENHCQDKTCRNAPVVLCFSCLSDVWEYLELESSGLLAAIYPSFYRTYFPRYHQVLSDAVNWTSPPDSTRDCALCAESLNCAGRLRLPAESPYPRRSCP